MSLSKQQPLNYTEKEYVKSSLNNLIKNYGEDSCIKICMDINQQSTIFSGVFIQYNKDKTKTRLRVNLNKIFTDLLERLLGIYMDKSKDYYPNKKDWEDLIYSENIMFTINDWLLMLEEYG